MRSPEIFVCSDWHLGHEKIATLTYRPPNFAELIFDHLKAAGFQEGDVLLNLGDVSLYDEGEAWLKRIMAWLGSRGVHRVLCKGNHDPKRLTRLLRMGWSWVCDSTSLAAYGKRFLFTHVPVETPFEEDYNVHGHLHELEGHRGGLIRDGKHILISSEMMRYRPIPLSTLAALGETPAYVLGKFVRGSNGQGNTDGSGDVEEPQEARGAASARDDGGDMRA